MLQWTTAELARYKTSPLHVEQTLDLEHELMSRDPEILSVAPVSIDAYISANQNAYLASVTVETSLMLPSTRSLTPVEMPMHFTFSEVYLPEGVDGTVFEEEGQLVIDMVGDVLNLRDAVADHILLEIPMQILTPDEAANGTMPAGEDWAVISSDDAATAGEDKPNPAFEKLKGLFDDEPE